MRRFAAALAGEKPAIHLLNIIFILSLLFTVTVGASSTDLGTPNCHSGMAAWNNHGDTRSHHLPQIKVVCTCDCPCCSYVAHLIPLLSTPVVVHPGVPETAYAELTIYWVSLTIPPQTHPPNA
jgi:hypothetical protein